MRICFLAGPYRAPTIRGVVLNVRAAESVAVELWKLGTVVPLCAHLNSALFDGIVPDEVFLEGALELLRRSDAIVLAPGWRGSAGARAELAEAERLGLPVFVWGDLDEARRLERWARSEREGGGELATQHAGSDAQRGAFGEGEGA